MIEKAANMCGKSGRNSLWINVQKSSSKDLLFKHMPQLKHFSIDVKGITCIVKHFAESEHRGSIVETLKQVFYQMHSYFLHVYKYKDVQPAIIVASKYLRAKFLLLPMWVFSPVSPCLHIFSENTHSKRQILRWS